MLYSDLADIFEKVKDTSKRLEKVKIVSNLLKNLEDEEIPSVVLLTLGKIFPERDPRETGVSSQTIRKVLTVLAGLKREDIVEAHKKTGDLGGAIETLLDKRSQTTLRESESLSLSEIHQKLIKLSEYHGADSMKKKERTLFDIFGNLTPREAKYVIRTILFSMYIGFNVGLMEESISKAFNVKTELIRRSNQIVCDLGEIALIAKHEGNEGLEKIKPKPLRPIKPMMAVNASLDELKGKFAFEYKYDGARIQLHRSYDKIKIFSRRLEDVTHAFPEIVSEAFEKIEGKEYIIEGEIIPEKGKEKLPFQELLHRLRRKYGVEEKLKEIPITFYAFDLLYYKSPYYADSQVRKPFFSRRKLLENIINESDHIKLSHQIVTDDMSKIRKFFENAVKRGYEGLMAKNLSASYSPGIRGKKMLKIKEALDTLDLVVVGAEYGEGRKSKYLSRFFMACLNDEFIPLAKVSSGLTDQELEYITGRLKEIIISEKGRIVQVVPEIILEVAFSEIQISKKYACGYTLRFPRIRRIREDLSIYDVDSLKRVKDMYKILRKRT